MLIRRKANMIRQFQEKDLQTVVQINRCCLPENYPDSFFLYIFNSFPEGFLVVEKDDKIIGYIMTRIEYGKSNYSKFRLVKKGHIISVAILPLYQKQGYGKQLLIKALIEMKKKDANECFLEVRRSNEIAHLLYESLNFNVIKELKKYYTDNESADLMCIIIPDFTNSS